MMTRVQIRIISYAAAILTASILLYVGYLFENPWLMFHHEYRDTAGLHVITGSVLAFVIGLATGYLSEKVLLYKYKRTFFWK